MEWRTKDEQPNFRSDGDVHNYFCASKPDFDFNMRIIREMTLNSADNSLLGEFAYGFSGQLRQNDSTSCESVERMSNFFQEIMPLPHNLEEPFSSLFSSFFRRCPGKSLDIIHNFISLGNQRFATLCLIKLLSFNPENQTLLEYCSCILNSIGEVEASIKFAYDVILSLRSNPPSSPTLKVFLDFFDPKRIFSIFASVTPEIFSLAIDSISSLIFFPIHSFGTSERFSSYLNSIISSLCAASDDIMKCSLTVISLSKLISSLRRQSIVNFFHEELIGRWISFMFNFTTCSIESGIFAEVQAVCESHIEFWAKVDSFRAFRDSEELREFANSLAIFPMIFEFTFSNNSQNSSFCQMIIEDPSSEYPEHFSHMLTNDYAERLIHITSSGSFSQSALAIEILGFFIKSHTNCQNMADVMELDKRAFIEVFELASSQRDSSSEYQTAAETKFFFTFVTVYAYSKDPRSKATLSELHKKLSIFLSLSIRALFISQSPPLIKSISSSLAYIPISSELVTSFCKASESEQFFAADSYSFYLKKQFRSSADSLFSFLFKACYSSSNQKGILILLTSLLSSFSLFFTRHIFEAPNCVIDFALELIESRIFPCIRSHQSDEKEIATFISSLCCSFPKLFRSMTSKLVTFLQFILDTESSILNSIIETKPENQLKILAVLTHCLSSIVSSSIINLGITFFYGDTHFPIAALALIRTLHALSIDSICESRQLSVNIISYFYQIFSESEVSSQPFSLETLEFFIQNSLNFAQSSLKFQAENQFARLVSSILYGNFGKNLSSTSRKAIIVSLLVASSRSKSVELFSGAACMLDGELRALSEFIGGPVYTDTMAEFNFLKNAKFDLLKEFTRSN